MTDEQWVVVPKWDEFQHYKKGRASTNMVWHKTYVSLLANPDFLGLTPGERALLQGLWLLTAASHGHVRLSTARLSRQLSLKVTKRQVDSLIDAGFITVSSRRPIAPVREDEDEDEDEEKKEQVQEPMAVEKRPATPAPVPRNDRDVQTVYDYWREKRGRSRTNYDHISPQRRQKIQARLKEFTVDDLKSAIDGIARDPWPERSQHDDLTVVFRSEEQVEKFLEMRSQPLSNGHRPAPSVAEMLAIRNGETGAFH